ncbi:hypothetical protein EX895_004074 [Sporisorium graminicola]|uniref:DUF7702 domain-containing protein n=1 Tax=Sporisorium graminicola TaxID=280036 RepID=A0A4U7KTL6_9BASI|nr:hypothetical protein EX895_004074 [Sporisorium graminicola]TKY87397.1 hypothetical protein EX895_004074 [Sporisorium graminicola]
MTWPTGIIIDTVFIPLYVAFALLNLLNVVKHGFKRTVGFISLLLVSLVHLVGNVILVVEYTKHDKASINVTVWGYILQSVGLSFLVSASLAFFARARAEMHDRAGQDALTGKGVKLLNLVNLAALVCVITGYTDTNFTDAQGNVLTKVSLPTQAVVGAVLYVVLVVVILALALAGLRGTRAAGTNETHTIRIALIVALPLMLVRAAWSVYTTKAGSILVPKSIWAKLVLQYISELAALAVLTALGFLISRAETIETELDIEQVHSHESTKFVSQPGSGEQSLAYQQPLQTAQQPISYSSYPPRPQ